MAETNTAAARIDERSRVLLSAGMENQMILTTHYLCEVMLKHYTMA